ncbi:hypothetical protein RCO48_06675 [Peribacillus frigoritolerans]|nr:hypothetical protein [Peribacillus frigoritolerans]
MIGHTNRFKAAVSQRCISNWLSFLWGQRHWLLFYRVGSWR